MALRVGHDKLTRETGWMPQVSWEDGVLQTIRWYAENRDRWIGRVDWLSTGAPSLSTEPSRRRRYGAGAVPCPAEGAAMVDRERRPLDP